MISWKYAKNRAYAPTPNIYAPTQKKLHIELYICKKRKICTLTRVGFCGSAGCSYRRYATNMQNMGGCILSIYCIYCIFGIYMQNMQHFANTSDLLQCVHLCIFDSEHFNCILVAVCHLSDSDSEDEFIHPALDDDDPSERCGGQSRRRDELYLSERRVILQDLQQRHSRLTFKTKSVEEAADIFEFFGNVSLCVLFCCIFCI